MRDARVSIMGRMSSGCLQVKAFHVVRGVIACHRACRVPLRGLEPSANRRGHPWSRVFNEASALLFAATVVRVVVKPL